MSNEHSFWFFDLFSTYACLDIKNDIGNERIQAGL